MNPLKLCLASPYALAGAHPVAEHVRGVATALAERGHRVTVLAPNSSTRALRSGRRRLRALAAGDHEALIALDGEPLQVAVAPAVPLRQRGRRRGVGLPVAARANVALAVGQGGFDIVHAFEPLLPGVATSALRHSPGLTVATFHAPDRTLHYPVRGGTLERYRARIDALLATSAAGRCRRRPRSTPATTRSSPRASAPAFVPGHKDGTRIAVEWHGEGRAVVRTLVKLAASTPGVELVLVWSRRSRRPLRPFVPAQARGRVHATSPEDADGRAAVLSDGRRLRRRRGRRPVAGLGGARVRVRGRRAASGRLARPGRARPRALRSTSRRSRRRRPPACSTTPTCARSSRRRGARPPRSGRFAAVAERVEQVYARLDSRRRRAPPPGARRPAGDLGRPAHAHEPLLRLRHRPRGAASTTASSRASARSPSPTTTRSPARSRRPRSDKPITVIVGEEVKTAQGEVIGLFLHERIEPGLSMGDTIAAIQEQGGLVYMPHPFDRLHTIPDAPTLLRHLDQIDILEVYNSRLLFDSFNDDALRFASKYNLIQAAGSDAHVLPGHRHGDQPHPRVRRARGVPARDAPERDPAAAQEPAVSSGAQMGAKRGQIGAQASGADRRIDRWVTVADDQIYERYQAKAIDEINALGHDIAEWLGERHPGAAPVLGTGHPLADILLVKHRPMPAEVQEGVAFFGRAGQAILKSLQRLRIDPLMLYGTACLKAAIDPDGAPRGTPAVN